MASPTGPGHGHTPRGARAPTHRRALLRPPGRGARHGTRALQPAPAVTLKGRRPSRRPRPRPAPASFPAAGSYSDNSHTAYASASAFRSSAVSLMLDVVSQDEW
ncbi:hypothetical protein GCM10027075_52180 [Streptomyces heilongjiangensis]